MATHSLNILSISSIPTSSNHQKHNPFYSFPLLSSNLISSMFAKSLTISPLTPNPIVLKRRSTLITVSFSLPTSEREGVFAEKLPKWSARAIKSFAMGELEARKLKYPNTGTEALLMGILVEGTSQAAKFLRENGITLFKVREEIVNLLGKSDMYFFSPEHPPLTEPAQKALDWAFNQKLNSGEGGEVCVTHLLLGVWAQKESAAHQIMSSMGFNDEKAKELLKYMDRDIVLNHK